MIFLKSLKFRIASAIFLVQLIVMSIVLWQMQTSTFQAARQLISDQDQAILDLLYGVSEWALFTNEYTQLQPYFKKTTTADHIVKVYLTDYREVVVASSDLELLGKIKVMEEERSGYWLHREFENTGERFGELHVKFSNKELQDAYSDTLTKSITAGLAGLLITAIISVVIGKVLTRRLTDIRHQTQRFANGEMSTRWEVSGNDEITDLGISWNLMADQISINMQTIEHMAFHDPLTGLANRREFHKRLSKALKAAKSHNHQFALLYLDLDQFKVVNDTCGHDAGDQLLKELSLLLQSLLRQRDTLVRLGGDEFGILLQSCAIDEAKQVAEKIRTAIHEFKFSWQDKMLQVGVSIGVAAINADSPDIKQIMGMADLACYTAKEKGRNAIHIAQQDDREIALRHSDMQWVNHLLSAIEKDLFILAYQRIKPIKSSEPGTAVEFLLRLKGDDGKIIFPGSFISAAERFDLMPRLDRYVIEKVFRLISSDYFEHKPDMVFINLSGMSIGEADFFDYIESCMKKYNVQANRVCFEVTETAAIINFNRAGEFLSKIRQSGCRVALDDFGSGMCSFNYLKSLPIDFVKIDGSFILNMENNTVDKSIVESINHISHEAGFRTIAEFIENESQLKQLTEIGIDFAQGFALHKPELIERFPK